MLLDFPDEAYEAAREYAFDLLGVRPEDSLDDRIELLECEIANTFSHDVAYGVEQALTSGKRLRLLHEMPEDKQMNCAEAGVNAFLLLAAFEGSENLRLLRYVPRNGLSTHFGVLRLNNGSNPRVVDPLGEMAGEIRFVKGGFIHYPLNYLGRSIDCPEDRPHKVTTDYEILTLDDVIRHVNFINSPLGFLTYYADGQKIRSFKNSFQHFEANIQVNNGEMSLSVVCFDHLLDIFSANMLFRLEGEDLRYSQLNTLSTGYRWIQYCDIVYVEGEEDRQVTMTNPKLSSTTAFVEFVRMLRDGGGSIYPKAEKESYVVKLRDNIKWGGGLFEKRREESAASPWDFDLDREVSEIKYELNHERLKLDYILGMKKDVRELIVDHMLFLRDYRRRGIRPRRPYGKFTRSESDPYPVLSAYTNTRYELFRPGIDEFVNSSVTETILDQYRNAIFIKRIAEANC